MPAAPRRGPIRLLLGLAIFFVVLALGAYGLFAVLLARVRFVPPDPPVDTSPAGTRRAETSAETIRKTVREAARDATARRVRPYRLQVKQNDLNTLLRTDKRVRAVLNKRNIERPFIAIKNGRLSASGLVTYQKRRVFLRAEGRVTWGKNGALIFRPDNVWLGNARAPRGLTKELAERAARAIQSGALTLPGRVTDVRLENGQLVIEGTTGK